MTNDEINQNQSDNDSHTTNNVPGNDNLVEASEDLVNHETSNPTQVQFRDTDVNDDICPEAYQSRNVWVSDFKVQSIYIFQWLSTPAGSESSLALGDL